MASEQGHTPGPWQITSRAGQNNHGVSAGHKRICSINTNSPLAAAERDANARLIAAAPDLLAALEAMVDRWEPDCSGQDRIMWENARAALTKATQA